MRIILLGCTPPPVGGIAKWTTRMMKADLGEDYELKFTAPSGRHSVLEWPLSEVKRPSIFN